MKSKNPSSDDHNSGRGDQYKVRVICSSASASSSFEVMRDHIPWLDEEIELIEHVWIVRSVDFYQEPNNRELVVEVEAEYGWPAGLDD